MDILLPAEIHLEILSQGFTLPPANLDETVGSISKEEREMRHTLMAYGSASNPTAKASKRVYFDLTTVASLTNIVAYATPATLLYFHVRISGPTFLSEDKVEDKNPKLDLSAFTELSDLRISELVGSNPIEPLKRVLENSMLPPNLEELHLDALIRVDWGEGGASEQLQTHRDKLDALDTVLASKFAAIPKIHLSVYFHVVNESKEPPFDKTAFTQTADRLLDEAFSGMLSLENLQSGEGAHGRARP